MLSIVRYFAFVLSVVLISACGGGGGGGSSADLSLSSNSLSFSANQNGALPATQTLSASWSSADVAAILAGYPPTVTPPAWLDITIQGNVSPISINLTVNTTNLVAGTYSTTVRVVSVDSNSNPIDIVDANVSFTVTAKLGVSGSSALTFNMVDGGTAPAAQSVGLVGDSINWTATASEAWVQLANASGTAPGSASVGIDPSMLSVGTHTATVTFSDSSSTDTVTLNVTLNVLPQLGIVGGPTLAFNMVTGGQAPQDQSVSLTGNGLSWNAAASASWIQLGSTSGTAPSNVTIGINPAGLAAGTYTATVTFTDSANIQSQTLNITLNIQAQLGISGSTALSFKMIHSGLAPLDQTVSLSGNGVNWLATPSETWIVLGSTSGTAAGNVSVGVDTSTLAAGIHTATVEFSDSLSLQSVTLNIELRIEPHKLSVEDNGFALASMPGLSILSTSVSVTENASVTTPWAASSSASWLSVTASGDTGNDLSISANPSGLATDTLHYATVTLTSSDTTIANSETIRVGLWVGSTDPNPTDSLALSYSEITADPIRPYVYMHNQGTAIEVYNVHTATRVTTINNVAAQLGDMEVSSDGTTLYATDQANFAIVPVNLDTMTAGTAWNLSGSGTLRLAYGRVDTKGLVFASNGAVYDEGTGSPLTTTISTVRSVLNVSQNGKKLCGINTGISAYTVACSTLAYSDLGSGTLSMTNTGSVSGPGGNARDVALLRDGSRVYVASGAPYNFIGFDTSTMKQDQTLTADAYPNSVEISADNRVYGGISSSYGPLDTWIYATDGVLQSSYYQSAYAKQIRDRQLVVSGDGLRMVVSVTDPAIKIVTTK